MTRAAGPPLIGRSGKPVPNKIPAPPDFARPDKTSPDAKAALTSGNRIHGDAVRRNRVAWHACDPLGSNLSLS